MVIIPAVGEFVIPDLLGGPDTLVIGKVLWEQFFTNRDWPVASRLVTVAAVVAGRLMTCDAGAPQES